MLIHKAFTFYCFSKYLYIFSNWSWKAISPSIPASLHVESHDKTPDMSRGLAFYFFGRSIYQLCIIPISLYSGSPFFPPSKIQYPWRFIILRDREVVCSTSASDGSNLQSCMWRSVWVSSDSSHHPQDVILAQFGLYPSKHKNMCITFVQRRPNVFAVGPTLYKCYTNALCSLICVHKCRLNPHSFQHWQHTNIVFINTNYETFTQCCFNIAPLSWERNNLKILPHFIGKSSYSHPRLVSVQHWKPEPELITCSPRCDSTKCYFIIMTVYTWPDDVALHAGYTFQVTGQIGLY